MNASDLIMNLKFEKCQRGKCQDSPRGYMGDDACSECKVGETIRLLSYSVPRKPFERFYDVNEGKFYYICPSCKTGIQKGEKWCLRRHCCYCGQTIDWTGEQ